MARNSERESWRNKKEVGTATYVHPTHTQKQKPNNLYTLFTHLYEAGTYI